MKDRRIYRKLYQESMNQAWRWGMFEPSDVPAERPKLRYIVGRQKKNEVETTIVEIIGLAHYLNTGWVIVGRDPADQQAWESWRRANPHATT